MARSGFMWECSCGHVEYSEEAPEECVKCGKLDSFIKMPEEIVEERLKESENIEQDISPKSKVVKKVKKSRSKK